MRRLRRQVYELLNPGDAYLLGRWVDVFIILLIALNVVMVIVETEEALAGPYREWFVGVERFSAIFFAVEYLLRLWGSVEDPRFAHPIKGRLRYMVTFFALVDLLAVAPFFLTAFVDLDLRFVRAVRMLRLVRLLKLGRYATSIKLIAEVFSRRKEELAITLFMISILLILSSSVIYLVEHDAQPEAFASIPTSMWWAIVTLTTVGYGDVHPVTGLGQFCGAIIALLGVGIVALPAGLIASGFNEIMKERSGSDSRLTSCPACGHDLRGDPAG